MVLTHHTLVNCVLLPNQIVYIVTNQNYNVHPIPLFCGTAIPKLGDFTFTCLHYMHASFKLAALFTLTMNTLPEIEVIWCLRITVCPSPKHPVAHAAPQVGESIASVD